MKIRIKLILALLAIALLPVYPTYVLVKHLIEQTLEVGYNRNVESALEFASGMTRQMYARYRAETLEGASRLASSSRVAAMLAVRDGPGSDSEISELIRPGRLELYDLNNERIYVVTEPETTQVAGLYQTDAAKLADLTRPEIISHGPDAGKIHAFAPVVVNGARSGSLVLTRFMDEQFVEKSQHVVRVNQMFKTLDFFEQDLRGSYLQVFFLVYTPIALLSIILGIYFSRKITSPLLELVDGTRRIAAGDWDHRVKVRSQDEVGGLVDSFNSMVSTLKQKQDQVVSLEKMAAWREIARVLAHEIKNPLTPIQLTIQQLQDKYPGGDPDYDKLLGECTEIINDEIESLRTLVREFSEFARMPKLNLSRGNLNELMQEMRKLYSGEPIDFDLQADLPEVNLDAEQLRRVAINLIENSLDSIREKGSGSVTITTHSEGDKIVWKHEDTGTGIPEDIRRQIFEPHFSTKKSGMGLGLAIVKRIIDEHGGQIAVESEEGKGAIFMIAMPTATK